MKEPIQAACTGKDRTQFRMTRDEARKLLVEPITFHLARDRSNLFFREFNGTGENTWSKEINRAVSDCIVLLALEASYAVIRVIEVSAAPRTDQIRSGRPWIVNGHDRRLRAG